MKKQLFMNKLVYLGLSVLKLSKMSIRFGMVT